MPKLVIEYCFVWNYYPRAASLAESIKKDIEIDIELKKSDGGRFEIYLDNEVVFSKYKEYRFPYEGEVEKILKERIG